MPVTLDSVISSQSDIVNLINSYCPPPPPNITTDSGNGTKSSTFEAERDISKNSCDHITNGSFSQAINDWIQMREDLLALQRIQYENHLLSISSEITDSNKIEERQKWCQGLFEHHKIIAEHKNLLAWYLQQPVTSSFLTMHHSYHKELEALLSATVAMISNVQGYMDYVAVKNNSYLPELNGNISQLTEAVNKMRMMLKHITTLQTYCEMIAQETANKSNYKAHV